MNIFSLIVSVKMLNIFYFFLISINVVINRFVKWLLILDKYILLMFIFFFIYSGSY